MQVLPRDSLDTFEGCGRPLLVLGGGMLVVASIMHPQGGGSQFVRQSLWVPAHIFEYAGWTTMLLGLVGWYSRFSASLGRLGTLGFLLFFLALATGVGYPLWSDILLGPYMAANSPSLYDALPTNNGFIATFLIFALALLVGYLLFSVAVVRARVLPRSGRCLMVRQMIGLASVFGSAIAFAAFLVFGG